MKLLYLINEPYEGYQSGYRYALDNLVKSNYINDFYAIPFIVYEQKLGSWDDTLKYIVHETISYQPELILIAHIGKRPFPKKYIDQIRSIKANPTLAYDERDVYGYFRKPLPAEILSLVKYIDITFLVAAGSFADRFRKVGCPYVYCLPHVASKKQFGTNWTPTNSRKYDVVMLANIAKSKLSLFNMPGIKQRISLAKKLTSVFGEKFGLFGQGWEEINPSIKPVKFFQQEEINRLSWLSVGYDHFPNYEFYYSDRLPIALFSGVAHLTNKTKGLENLFIDQKHLFFYNTVDEAVNKCKYLLDNKSFLIRVGLSGSEYAKKYFSEELRMKRLLSIMIDHYKTKQIIPRLN